MRITILLLSILLFSCSTSSVEYRTATTALRNDRDYNKAEEYALKALELNAEDALPAYFLAMEVYGAKNSPKNDYQKAAYYFQQSLVIDAIDGKDQKLEESKMVSDGEEGYKELTTIKQAVEYYTFSIWAEVFNLGIQSKNKGDNEQAIELFTVCIGLMPNRIENYDLLSTLYFEGKNYEKAIEYADIGLNLDANYSILWSIKGIIAMNNDNNIQAEDMLRKAYNLALDSNESVESLSAHMSRLFDVLFKNGKKDEALRLSEELIEQNPEDVALYSNSGVVYKQILEDAIVEANTGLSNLNNLSELELEALKIQFEDCINLATKARQNFLMCSELELDEIESQRYYDQSKRLKIQINEIKRQIKNINKALDESE